MQNANHGYVGWSISVRAAAAYESGEMPKSKWTKKAMLAAIADALHELDVKLTDAHEANLKRLPKNIIFNNLFIETSWHHTSKMFNRTSFYSVYRDRLALMVREGAEFRIDYHLVEYGVGKRHFDNKVDREAYIEARGLKVDGCPSEGHASIYDKIR